MTRDQLIFGAAAISAAPVQNTGQMRHKAAWLEWLADEIELLQQNDTVAKPGDVKADGGE